MPNFLTGLQEHRSFRIFIIVLVVISAVYFIVQKINGRDQMADFKVYHDAANELVHDKNMYGQSFGVSSGFYKYSPIAAVPFIPFTWLPYKVATGIYYFLIVAGIALVVLLVMSLTGEMLRRSGRVGLILAIGVLFIADHIERELHLGNVNLWLMLTAIVLFRCMIRGKKLMAGILYGIMLLYKPHFLILFPWFLWNKEWKLSACAIITLSVGLLSPSVFIGWNKNMDLLHQWFTAMKDHNVHLAESPNTIYGIINSFVLVPLGMTAMKALLIFSVAFVAGLFLCLMIYNRKTVHGTSHYLYLEYFLLLALIPTLAHTDTEHFMWTFPLIIYSLWTLFNFHVRYRWLSIIILILAFFPFTLNSPDIVGKKMSLLFDEGGLLGVANILLIGATVYLFQYGSRTKFSRSIVSGAK